MVSDRINTIDSLLGDVTLQKSIQMQSYQNLGGDSGVSAYEIGPDSLTVLFKDGWYYFYTYASTGSGEVEMLKQLAVRGVGLNSYINATIKANFAHKWK